jgi:hypothetical protein
VKSLLYDEAARLTVLLRITAAGLTQALSAREVEPLFTLSFALDQLPSNLTDLERYVHEWKTV